MQEGPLTPLAQRHHPRPLAEGGLVAAHDAGNSLVRLHFRHPRPAANELRLTGNIALLLLRARGSGRRRGGLARGGAAVWRAGRGESHGGHLRPTSGGWLPAGARLVLALLLLVLQSWRRVARDQRPAWRLARGLHGRLQIARQARREARGDLERDVRQDGRLEPAQARDEIVCGRVARDNLAGHLKIRTWRARQWPVVVVVVLLVLRQGLHWTCWVNGGRRCAIVLGHEEGRAASASQLDRT